MELPEDVVQTVDEFEGKLGELEKLLLPIFQVDFQTLVSSLSPLDNAKFHLTVAYALNTLFYMYLKTQGHPPADHPVANELLRVKEYMQKLQESTQPQKGPATRVNKPAASRVIAHGTGLARQQQEQEQGKGKDEEEPKEKQEKTEDKGTTTPKRKKPKKKQNYNNNNKTPERQTPEPKKNAEGKSRTGTPAKQNEVKKEQRRDSTGQPNNKSNNNNKNNNKKRKSPDSSGSRPGTPNSATKKQKTEHKK